MKPLGYFVIHRGTCPTCKGSRLVQHPTWTEFWREWPTDSPRPLFDMPKFIEWWHEHGYHADDVPPEEIECHGCDGTGYVEREVSLGDALKAIATE